MKAIDRLIQSWRIKLASKVLGNNLRVIDIGSHDGELFAVLGSRLKEGFGIEPLKTNKQVYERYTINPGYFPQVYPDSQQWDAITMLAVLEHIPSNCHQELAMSCRNFLKNNGLVIITVPSPLVDYILNFLRFLKLIDGMSLEEHYGFKPEETLSIFHPPYFRLIKHKTFQFGLNNLYILQKTNN